jgi:hypothetical protein
VAAPKGARTLFTHAPSNRVNDVRFTATIGSNDGNDTIFELQIEFLGK